MAMPLVRAKERISKVPRVNQTLIELYQSREGAHLFVFPFDGRLVHAGMASIVALRLGRLCKGTFAIAQNDYGFELLSQHPYPFADLLDRELFSPLNIVEDARAGVQLSSLARLQFREVARISGLVFQHHPGARKSSRQLQSSSGLIFDVFEEFDPEMRTERDAANCAIIRERKDGRLIFDTIASDLKNRELAVEIEFCGDDYPKMQKEILSRPFRVR